MDKKKDGGFDPKEEKIAFEESPTFNNAKGKWHPDKEDLSWHPDKEIDCP
jgi:hypothetical protein